MANEEVRSAQTLFDCCNEIEKYKCATCPNFQTSTLARLRSHIRDGHRDEQFDEYVYKCLKCLFVTNLKYLMGRHSLFSECATNRLNDEHEKQKRFLCYQTSTEPNFRFSDEPQTAFDEKNEVRQFQYEQCPSEFKDKSNLSRDVKLVHAKPGDIKWYQCEECSLKFSKLGLASHKKFRHTKPLFFECEECPSKFKIKSILARHKKFRHSKAEDICWFRCEWCTYKCKVKSSLKKHFQARHANPEDIKWFVCEQCSYKCKEKGNLKKHFQSHHAKAEDIKYHECEQCLSKFKSKSSLKYHLKNSHPKPEDIKWYQCEECSSKYKTKFRLANHKKWRHTKPKDIHLVST